MTKETDKIDKQNRQTKDTDNRDKQTVPCLIPFQGYPAELCLLQCRVM